MHRIYGYPGDGINGIMGAFGRMEDGIQFVQARHEELAAFMATAHAKFTGEVGVCLATSGPGAIHLLNGFYDAKFDHQPVVAIVGQQKRAALGATINRKSTCCRCSRVASPPDSDAIMPRRILRSRAYQLAADPESQVRHRAVAEHGNHMTVRVGVLGGDRVRHCRPHGSPIGCSYPAGAAIASAKEWWDGLFPVSKKT